MGSIDDYKYPDLDVDEAVSIAETLVNQHGGDVTSEETFAQDAGHSSANSGAFKQKIADCRKYGLMASRGYEATKLAHKVANPLDERSLREGKFEMYQNVRLLQYLHDHLDGREPPAEFWRVLTELCDTNPKEAKEQAGEIEGLYRAMIRVEPSEPEESKESTEGEGGSQGTESVSPPVAPSGGGIFLQVGEETLSLDLSVSNLQLAQAMLKIKESELASASEGSTGAEEHEEGDQSPGLEEFLSEE